MPTNQGDQATGGGDPPEGVDPFLTLMNEETKRLQSKGDIVIEYM